MHEDYTLLMSQVLDKEATPTEATLLFRHLGQCATCAATWDRWRLLDHHLKAAPMIAPPRSLVPAVLSRLEGRHQQLRRRWVGSGLLFMWGLIILAALVALALVVAWGVSHPLDAGIAISFAAQLLSGLTRFLRGFRLLFGGVGGTALSAVLGLYLIATGGLLLLWLRVISRRPGPALVRAVIGNSFGTGGL